MSRRRSHTSKCQVGTRYRRRTWLKKTQFDGEVVGMTHSVSIFEPPDLLIYVNRMQVLKTNFYTVSLQ